MTVRKRRKIPKLTDLQVANPGSHHSDIQQANETPSKSLPHLHLSGVGKEDAGVKLDLATSSRSQAFKDALGTTDENTGWHLLAQALHTIPDLDLKRDLPAYRKGVLATLRGIGPRDQLEGLLAVQMLGVHHLALKFLSIARDPSELASEGYLKRAVKLLRTFGLQMEALSRHRGNTSQQMVVGNVTIADGGQAIVGPVNHPGPGKVSNDEKVG
jgi:hypothetical protein